MGAASRTLVLCLAVLLAGFGCAPKLFEVCTDGLDNNGNGRIDCQDEGCSTHPYCRATVYNTYVGEHPSGREVQWAEGVQGVTHDDGNWYITQTRTLWRIPAGVDLDSAARGVPGVGTVELQGIGDLWRRGYDHFGDPGYYKFEGRGYLFVPLEDDRREAPPAVAVFYAENLRYIGYAVLDGLEAAPWCALDPQGVLYSSNTTNSGAVHTFEVDWTTLRSGGKGWLKPAGRLTLLDESGYPVTIDTPQGGVISQNGRLLYISAGYCEGSHPSWGIHVFDLQTRKRIARSGNGSGPFNYEFHPAWRCSGEEPEGMTIWDLDGSSAPPQVAGGLHVLMLDNDIGDDEVYFKHYTHESAYPVMYEHVNYGGRPFPLRASIYSNLEANDFNDMASSIWIPSGWSVEVFKDADFAGDSVRLTAPDANLHEEGWHDSISSIRVFPPADR